MEAEGAIKNITSLLKSGSAYICSYMMDDDSSTKAVLQHPKPVDPSAKKKKGKIKKDTGLLPSYHPVIKFIADKNHRVGKFANKIFELSALPRSQTSCTKADAERLKQNFAYFIHMYHGETFKKFQWHAKAVMEHHFNNHQFCDERCPAKKWKKEDKIRKQLRYRSKEVDAKFYNQLLTIFDAFTTLEALRELYHNVHSNKCESMNGFITKFVPTDKDFCRTIANKARTLMAIGIDSVGYEDYFASSLKS
jgi:hypothetical protein